MLYLSRIRVTPNDLYLRQKDHKFTPLSVDKERLLTVVERQKLINKRALDISQMFVFIK